MTPCFYFGNHLIDGCGICAHFVCQRKPWIRFLQIYNRYRRKIVGNKITFWKKINIQLIVGYDYKQDHKKSGNTQNRSCFSHWYTPDSMEFYYAIPVVYFLHSLCESYIIHWHLPGNQYIIQQPAHYKMNIMCSKPQNVTFVTLLLFQFLKHYHKICKFYFWWGYVSVTNILWKKLINAFSRTFQDKSNMTKGTFFFIIFGIVFNPLDAGFLFPLSKSMFVSNITEKWMKIFSFNLQEMFPSLLCSLMMCSNNWVHYGPMVIFICLHITLPHYRHYAHISESIELLKCLSGRFC